LKGKKEKTNEAVLEVNRKFPHKNAIVNQDKSGGWGGGWGMGQTRGGRGS